MYLARVGPLPDGYEHTYPFRSGDVMVILGEIDQMPGHVVVANIKTGQVFCGFHADNFIRLSKDKS